jgi:hypothetical protein
LEDPDDVELGPFDRSRRLGGFFAAGGEEQDEKQSAKKCRPFHRRCHFIIFKKGPAGNIFMKVR